MLAIYYVLYLLLQFTISAVVFLLAWRFAQKKFKNRVAAFFAALFSFMAVHYIMGVFVEMSPQLHSWMLSCMVEFEYQTSLTFVQIGYFHLATILFLSFFCWRNRSA